MADNLTPEKRSWNMSRIKGKDTSIEVKVRQFLFKNGFRFRKNVKTLPGKPDIVLPKYKAVVFVHGCFWHRHEGCKEATMPKTKTEYWQKKFEHNIYNDRQHEEELTNAGWRVFIVWECEVTKHFNETMHGLIDGITDGMFNFK